MTILIRVLTFALFYVLASKGKGMALLGVGATVQSIAVLVVGFFASVVIGDTLAKKRRGSAPGAAKQGKWDR